MGRGTTAAPPRRQEVLAFIIERIVREGFSPTYEEIGQALGFGETRARQLVSELVQRGFIYRKLGTQRNLCIRDVAAARVMLDEALRERGWLAADPMGVLMSAPCPQAQVSRMPPFVHLPDPD